MANRVSYIIQLKDKFSDVGERVRRQFDKIDGAAARTSAKIRQFSEKAQQSLQQFGKRAAAVGGAATAALTVPIVLMGRRMINAASDAEETANKFGEVFKGIETQSAAAVSELTSGFFLAQSSAQELLSNTGDLLVGLGLTRSQALDLSASVVKLSADVASFKNVEGDTARAAEALTKALLGEREMLKETFKTAVQEEEVKKRALIIRAKDRKLTEQQAKALATLAIVTDRNKDAVGDLARTADSYANVARRNSEATKKLKEDFGALLLPIAVKLTKALTKLANWLSNLSPFWKQLILVFGAIVAIGGPLLLVLGGIAIAVAAISAPVLIVTAVILGLIAVGVLLAANWDKIVAFLREKWDSFVGFLSKTADRISGIFSGVWEGIKSGLASVINWGINQLNKLVMPLSFVADALGFDLDLKKIPTIGAPAITVPEIPSLVAPAVPIGGMGGTVSGNILVSAAPGAEVKATAMRNEGPGLNLGLNMQGAF